jgi:hypothetical protein
MWQSLTRIQQLTMKRVSHILSHKLSGGYDSSCLLLVALAEVKQLISKNGNDLINRMNERHKKYSAFRRPLKELTADREYVASSNKGKS